MSQRQKTQWRCFQVALLVQRERDRSEGFALMGYDIPGCVEDWAWMLCENSSVVAVAAAVVAHPGLGGGR